MKMTNNNNNEEQRMFRMVMVLKSGKSIVLSVFEKAAFDIYNQWIYYNNHKPAEPENMDDPKQLKKYKKELEEVYNKLKEFDKIIVEKKSNNKIVEVSSILVSEVVSIQLDLIDSNKKKD